MTNDPILLIWIAILSVFAPRDSNFDGNISDQVSISSSAVPDLERVVNTASD